MNPLPLTLASIFTIMLFLILVGKIIHTALIGGAP